MKDLIIYKNHNFCYCRNSKIFSLHVVLATCQEFNKLVITILEKLATEEIHGFIDENN